MIPNVPPSPVQGIVVGPCEGVKVGSALGMSEMSKADGPIVGEAVNPRYPEDGATEGLAVGLEEMGVAVGLNVDTDGADDGLEVESDRASVGMRVISGDSTSSSQGNS